MNLTKTRIWGSPLVPSPPPEGDEGPQSDSESGGERALDLGKTRAAPVEQLQRAPGELSPRISPRTGTRIMNLATLLPRMRREAEASSELPDAALVRGATRILPIEQLTRALQSERSTQYEHAAASDEESEAGSSQQQRAPTNVLRLVCVALAALCIVLWVAAALVKPAPGSRLEGSAGTGPAALPTALAARGPEPARVDLNEPGSAATSNHERAEPTRPTMTADDTRPRAAVDALVRGDEELALSLYDELASARPEQPVFAEAARILRTRQVGER